LGLDAAFSFLFGRDFGLTQDFGQAMSGQLERRYHGGSSAAQALR
jgi:hypothetical protein